jgi:ABC-type Fe3+ transport system substrate-binding protein
MKIAKIITFAALSGMLVLASLNVSGPRLWAGSAPERQQLLDKLVEGARKEGELVVWGIQGMGDDGGRALGKAFNARFGLNLRFKYDQAGATGEKFSRAVMETQMGLPASYDAMYAPDHRVVSLIAKGGVESIERWELLLPDGIDPKYASPSAVAGQAFVFGTRANGIIYNTKLISAKDLPQTTKQVGLPKYKGKFYTAPWTTYIDYGILVYPKEEWLEIMRAWGQHKVTTIRSRGGIERMMMGEFVFEPFSNTHYYFEFKPKGDPIGAAFFQDVVPLSVLLHVVRKKARHPNAGKLFTLWATGSEANQIFEKYSGTPNMYLKTSQLGNEEAGLVKQQGAKPVTWFDTKENMDKLMWYTTAEGEAYEGEIAKALKLK